MINSATAYERLAEMAKPIIWESHKVLACGMTYHDLEIWLKRQGFRTDTPRSTLVRWVQTWLSCNQIIMPVETAEDQSRKIIWCELPVTKAHDINSAAIAKGFNYIYGMDGAVSFELLEKIEEVIE